jgi:endo-1,4-beta-xylanase
VSRHRKAAALGVALTLALGTAAFAANHQGGPPPWAGPPGADAPETLRDAAPEGFRIGTAVAAGPLNNNETYREVLAREFNSVTAENVMKWQTLQPQRGNFNFGPGDTLVGFAADNDMEVYGHTLVWHNQLPFWVNQVTDPEEFRDVVKEHVQTVVGHYQGRVNRWDVVNEPIADQGGALRDTLFLERLGPDYIADAFRWAHEADPDADLYINDYNVSWVHPENDDKGEAFYELVKGLVEDGVPIDGVGFQGHYHVTSYMSFMDEPVDQQHVTEHLRRFADLGLKVAITEVDVGIPLFGDDATSVQLHAQAGQYGLLMQACLRTPGCDTFTVWGFTDNHSWIPGHRPGWGAATIFDTDYEPKPAYHELFANLEIVRQVWAPPGVANKP